MKRVLLSGAAAIALLLVPAGAQAGTQSGAVLRVARAHHKVEIVDSRHAVHAYTVARRAARKLRPGARVTFRAGGKRIQALRVTGRTRKLAFYGKVVKSGSKGLVLRLGDAQRLRLGKKQVGRHSHKPHAHRSSVQINLEGLEPGQVVLTSEAVDAAGNVTVTIKLVPHADLYGDDEDVTGTITAIGAASMTVQVDGAGQLTFQADAELLDGFELGDQVDVSYYDDGTGTLVADDIEPLDDTGDEDLDAVGTVTALGADSISVNVEGQGVMTFEADADLLEGLLVGDQVDVAYYQDDDGTLVADDVEPADDAGDDTGTDDSGDDTSSDDDSGD